MECYIEGGSASDNKALLDAVVMHRGAIEAAFGGPLHWQRLHGRSACRISTTVAGGWADERTWPAATEAVVEAMARLHAALAPVFARLTAS